jgi:hypothetical protein
MAASAIKHHAVVEWERKKKEQKILFCKVKFSLVRN